MKNNNEELNIEIKKHRAAGIALFKEGQEIHATYLAAPDKYELTDEIKRFTGKQEDGTAEIQKAIELQKQYLENQRRQ